MGTPPLYISKLQRSFFETHVQYNVHGVRAWGHGWTPGLFFNAGENFCNAYGGVQCPLSGNVGELVDKFPSNGPPILGDLG